MKYSGTEITAKRSWVSPSGTSTFKVPFLEEDISNSKKWFSLRLPFDTKTLPRKFDSAPSDPELSPFNSNLPKAKDVYIILIQRMK